MTQRKLTDDEKQVLQDAFTYVDKNRSGTIDKGELRAILQLMGQNPTLDDMETYKQHFGTDEDGFSRDSLCEFIEEKVKLKTRAELDEEIATAFSKLGDTGDVTIAKEELIHLLTDFGQEPLKREDVELVLHDLKVSENGRLDIAEVAAFLKT